MFKKILVFSIIFVLCAIVSISCFAISPLTTSYNNSVSNTSMRNTTVDNSLNIGTSTTNIDNTTYSQNINQNEPDSTLLNSSEVATLTTTNSYEDSGELSVSNIINIILIVVGIVLILLGIAIVIKIK